MVTSKYVKFLIVIILFVCVKAEAQLELHIEGSNGVDLYVGQLLIVQAEGDVSTASGGGISFENGGTPDFRLYGDFTNHTAGIYTLGTEKIRFNGSALQNADFGGDDVYGIYTDNATHVQITSNVTLTGDLEFVTGNIQSTDGAHITLETTATVTGADNDSHNNGPISKNFAAGTNFVLPTGHGSSYNPISFEPDGATATTMKGTYYFTVPSSRSSLGVGLNNVSNLEQWDLVRTAGTEDGDVTLSWDANSAVGTHTELVVAYWDGALWQDGGGAVHTGNAAAGTVKSNTISTFGNKFTLASTTANNPLPVELIEFDAVKNTNEKDVDVLWKTASEINNDYFVIERSPNGMEWAAIDSLNGAGNSSTILSYYYMDDHPFEGVNFYRLRQVDFDNSYSYSNIRIVNFEGIEIVQLFPNPTDGKFNVVVQSSLTGFIFMTIHDALGKIVKSQKIHVTQGLNVIPNELEAANGKYFIKVITVDGRYYHHNMILMQ